MNLRIRIADDEELIRKSLVKLLTAEGYDVDAVGSAAEVLESVRNDPPQILILDLRLPDGSGLELLPRLKSIEPSLKVVVITAFGDLATAVQAMRQGATDFIKKPYEMHEMVLAIERLKAGIARENQLDAFRRGELESFLKTKIVGEAPAMRRIWDLVGKVSKSEATTVLIEGESGTGKDLVARAIHFESARRESPFLALNCSSFSEHLLENELFGHERGAFTDAREPKRGLVELADQGTLFLDEIADLPAATQAKFLRFIEDRTFKRVGGASDPLERAVLDEAQELRLSRGRQIRDLVQEKRALVRQLHQTALGLACVGEGAPLVAEELVLEQMLRKRGAVERQERRLAPGALEVDGAGRSEE